MAEQDPRRRRIRQVVIAASVLVAVAAVVFGGVYGWTRHRSRVVSEVITRPAPEYGPHAHVLLPNLQDATVVVPDRPHDPAEVRSPDRFARITRLRRFQVSTNALGMRGRPPHRPKRGPRVLAVGDSVTFGWGVAQAHSYPAQLSQELGVEVLNGGVPAMKPATIAAWTQEHAPDLDPDLVLFTRRPDHALPDPWGDYQRAVRQVQRAVRPARVAVVMPPVSTFDPQGSQQWEDERRRAKQLLRPLPVLDLTPAFRAAQRSGQGGPGVVMELADGVQRMRRLPDGELLVEAPAPAHGLAPALVAAFESDEDLAEPLFFDGGHPDARGFEFFAGELARLIRSEELLPPSR